MFLRSTFYNDKAAPNETQEHWNNGTELDVRIYEKLYINNLSHYTWHEYINIFFLLFF